MPVSLSPCSPRARRPAARAAFCVCVLAIAAEAGCARASTPQGVAAAYAGALDRAQSGRAWELHAAALQAGMSRARFDAEFERRAAGDQAGQRVRRAADQPAQLQSTVSYSEFEAIELGFIGGRWVVTGGLGLRSQDSPRAALRAFIRAVESGDAASILPLVPADFRVRMSESDLAAWLESSRDELEETVALLKSHADAQIRDEGDQATLHYGTRTMLFSREGQRWVIADFD